MMLQALVIAIFICINQIECDWKLIWHDEFSDPRQTRENWVIENEIAGKCTGNYVDQLNCNSDQNIVVYDGKLLIRAVNEDYLDKRFTSGKLTMKSSFTFGKYEINASLPVGKLLRPAIYLMPNVVDITNWKLNGQMEVMSNTQNQSITSGIIYEPSTVFNVFETTENLSEFNIYTLEWNSNEVLWIFNNECYYFKFDLNKILGPAYERPVQPFDGSFKLMIHLGVGGVYWFKPNELTNSEASNWTNPYFVIDYVRFYQEGKSNYKACTINNKPNNTVGIISTFNKNSCNGPSIANILFSFINLLINIIILDFIMKFC